MKNLLGSAPAPSFDDPLEMLLACHGRIQRQCETLIKLLAHLPTHGCDTQAQQAARAILRYFDTAGRHHHADEELDLFPRLLASSSIEAHALVARLLREHLEIEAAWPRLRINLIEIEAGKANTLDARVAEHFIDLYHRHITLENAQLLPLAQALLTAEQLAALGASMATRRSS